nr:hypothetical protein [Tanacetum cinerariifolium]
GTGAGGSPRCQEAMRFPLLSLGLRGQEDQPRDQLGFLSAAKVLADTARRNVQTYTRRRALSTGSGGVSTASRMISTAEESVSTAEPRNKDVDELSQDEVHQLMIIVLEQGMNVEALQTKYPIIDWEIYTKDTRKYWKVFRVGNHTEVYQFFDNMLNVFDSDDLVQL